MIAQTEAGDKIIMEPQFITEAFADHFCSIFNTLSSEDDGFLECMITSPSIFSNLSYTQISMVLLNQNLR
jgi:hypothetical protein